MSNEEKALQIIKSDEMIMKYLCDYTWISGESTRVYPITIWRESKEIALQVKSGAYRLRTRIANIAKSHPDIFTYASFSKLDGSCPDEIVFYYK